MTKKNILSQFFFLFLPIFLSAQALIPLKKNNLWGFADTVGNVIIEPIYNNVQIFENGYSVVRKNGKEGVIDSLGKTILSIDNEKVKIYSSVIFSEENEYKRNLITKEGKVILEADYWAIQKTNSSYIKVKNGQQKEGLFAPTGKKIFDIKYDQIRYISEGVWELAVRKKNEKGNYWIVALYDEKGEAILEKQYTKIEVISDTLFLVATSLNLQANNKPTNYFLANEKGDFLNKKPFDKLEKKTNNLFLTTKNYRQGFINAQGQEVLDCAMNEFHFFLEDSLIIGRQGANQFYFGHDGVLLFEDAFRKAFPFQDSLAIVAKMLKSKEGKNIGRYGIIHQNGKIIMPFKYKRLDRFSEKNNDYFIFKEDLKYGLIAINGDTIIPPLYDKISNFNEKFVLATKKGTMGLLNLKNETILPFEYEKLETFSNNSAINSQKITLLKTLKKEDNPNQLWGLANTSGKIIAESKYRWIRDFQKGGFAPIHGKKLIGQAGLIDLSGKELFDIDALELHAVYLPSSNLVTVAKKVIKNKQEGYKYGAINKEGILKISLEFDNYLYFTNEKAIAKKENKTGVITTKNEIIIPFEYQNITLHEDKYWLEKEGKIGIADLTGKVLIEPKYDQLVFLENGWLKAYKDGVVFGYFNQLLTPFF